MRIEVIHSVSDYSKFTMRARSGAFVALTLPPSFRTMRSIIARPALRYFKRVGRLLNNDLFRFFKPKAKGLPWRNLCLFDEDLRTLIHGIVLPKPSIG
jgi:hypothetical protein